MKKNIYLDQIIYSHLANSPDKFGFGIDEQNYLIAEMT